MTLPKDLVAEAKSLKVNISRACESGLAQAVKAAREARWTRDNASSLAASNAWVEEHGLPLAHHRQF